MNYGTLKHQLDRGYLPDDVETMEPAAVKCRGHLEGQWRETATGRIISEERAGELNAEQETDDGFDHEDSKYD